ncbi:DUF3164 family protein [Rhizobium ruizarguesonis]|uniref:DUF3164 family protein n=1 Tax=Rhizobium ruizarguesonis TaxID=2081791 RepID=UPI00102FEE37|nr:DUF3164 family protein [Rhizobium ruizarguesonis]TAZ95930.1 DUF3164 family protein [Rhizobium ruizarguesonis]
MEAVLIEQPSETEAAAGIIPVNGRSYVHDAKGNLVPLENVKAEHKLEDEIVRKITAFAEELSAQIARFRGHTMTDLGDLDALLAQEYGAKIGGAKGNRTYQTYDGLMKVQVQISDFVDFGPQLQVAKKLLDECLMEWSADSRPEIRAVITKAFNTEKEGQVNRSEIFMLLRLDIDDPRWQDAMRAIREAMRITGSKEYVRFYKRASTSDGWQAITIDLAKV